MAVAKVFAIFASQSLRRINARFAADGNLAGARLIPA
jgi:hypothetical protein